MKIALIDDHPIIIDGYKAILVSKEIEKEKNIELFTSINEAYSFINQKVINKEFVDLFVIDYNMPEDKTCNIKNGVELAFKIREFCPNSKIVLLTSINTPLLLYDIMLHLQPEGLWLKSDIGLLRFVQYISNVISGGIVYSESVKKAFKNVGKYTSSIDEYNRKILLLINDGVKTKNLPQFLNLSLDTINHRKANLKSILDLDSGDDYQLVNKAKSLGLL